MRRRFLARGVLVAFALALALGGTTRSQPATRAPATELTVSAAISLKDTLDEIARLYSAEHPDVAVRFNVGGSGTLQRQIEQGAPVDIFISASPKELESLESKGLLLPGTRRDLVKNSLVLIVPAGKSDISGFQDLTKPAVKLISIGEPKTVPAGQYAQETLIHLGVYDQLKSKLVLAKDVRQVLTYVETGNADAGIVYATDAKASTKVKTVATAPENSHSPVIYPAAVIKDSRHADAAKRFLEFLAGEQASVVFQRFGFIPTGKSGS